MIVALTIDLTEEWAARLSRFLADRAMVVPAAGGSALGVAQRLPVSLVVMDAEPPTTEKLLDYRRLCELAGPPVTICLGPTDVREQMRADRLCTPDFWLTPDADSAHLQETLTLALEKAQLADRAAVVAPAPPDRPAAATGAMASVPLESIFRNLLSAMAGDPDTERLLSACVEAAVQMAQCAGYCLLWDEGGGDLRVKTCLGLPPELARHGRLAPTDALVTWYGQNCRALTRQELSRWPDAHRAAALGQELDLFRGQVVMPLLPGGQLRGLLLLGEKVIGEPYTTAELETLFALTGYVTLRLENLQLQEQVRHTQTYMEHSLSGMRCGLITLGPDDRIIVCNPYAARLLGRKPGELEGADLRALPSPVGDLLYAARQSPEGAVSGEPIALSHRDQHLRATTSTLFGEGGRIIGAVLLLEDATGAVEDAAAGARQDTINALTRIIGRIAHEVRTPLTAIQTYAELMSSPDDVQELARFWRDTVNPELERLDRLITEQVALVEVPEPQVRQVQLEQVVQQVVDRAREDHPTAPPALRVVEPMPEITADPGPTADALYYLLRYLYDHGTSGVGVVVDQPKGPARQVRVRLRVTANGECPSAAEILDPLVALQLEDGDLGPAIGQQLVTRQGGTVEAVTGPDYLEFRVSFPVSEATLPQATRGE
jgi:nitrogen-specific signal transduction histidine kinase